MRTLVIGWLAGLLSVCLAAPQDPDTRPPNIILIVADDLGYAELGCYGQKKIRTPNIDALAAQGMRFTQAYAGNAVCAPSRCVLMTGKHPGHAWVRDNSEVQPEGQKPIPDTTITVAELLKQVGYATGAFGKWGLGFPGSEGDPLKQGFDRFYGYNCQRHAHNYYPTYLRDDDRRVPLDNPGFPAHDKLSPDADPNDPSSYRRFAGRDYAPDRITEQALRFIQDHKNEPFFLFVPTVVPHLAVQVPEDSLAEYQGDWEDPPYPGGKGYLPHFSPRAAYAAMITRMDRDVGRLVESIQKLGLDSHTIFLFSSDNGPTYNRLGGSDSEFFQSAGPFRGLKGSLYEGGIRVPLIVRWTGHVKARTRSDRVIGFEDLLPTLLALAGTEKDLPTHIDGISFAPTLLGQPQEPRAFLYREFPAYGGQQSIRVGDWKGIRQGLRRGPQPMELYNLQADPAEQNNVAEQHPDQVARLTQLMRAQHEPSAEFPFPALD